jgi:hypothetical protein
MHATIKSYIHDTNMVLSYVCELKFCIYFLPLFLVILLIFVSYSPKFIFFPIFFVSLRFFLISLISFQIILIMHFLFLYCFFLFYAALISSPFFRSSSSINVLKRRVSSGSIVSEYRLDYWMIGVPSPAEAKDFSYSLSVQTGSETHPASCLMGNGGPFPGCRARPGRDADP